jgi:hypothetical protein
MRVKYEYKTTSEEESGKTVAIELRDLTGYRGEPVLNVGGRGIVYLHEDGTVRIYPERLKVQGFDVTISKGK